MEDKVKCIHAVFDNDTYEYFCEHSGNSVPEDCDTCNGG